MNNMTKLTLVATLLVATPVMTVAGIQETSYQRISNLSSVIAEQFPDAKKAPKVGDVNALDVAVFDLEVSCNQIALAFDLYKARAGDDGEVVALAEEAISIYANEVANEVVAEIIATNEANFAELKKEFDNQTELINQLKIDNQNLAERSTGGLVDTVKPSVENDGETLEVILLKNVRHKGQRILASDKSVSLPSSFVMGLPDNAWAKVEASDDQETES